MLANAAGPIFALYTMAVALPKLEMVGTGAWFFLLINAFKVPFSFWLGLIHGQTLLLNLALVPAILVGCSPGRWVVRRLPAAGLRAPDAGLRGPRVAPADGVF